MFAPDRTRNGPIPAPIDPTLLNSGRWLPSPGRCGMASQAAFWWEFDSGGPSYEVSYDFAALVEGAGRVCLSKGVPVCRSVLAPV